jgi:hypothetical protein
MTGTCTSPKTACVGSHDVPGIIDAMGGHEFEATLSSVMSCQVGADHIAVYRFDSHGPSALAAISLDGTGVARKQTSLYVNQQLWRRDPFLGEAPAQLEGLHFAKTAIADIADHEFRGFIYEITGIRERMSLCGRRPRGMIWVNILRTHAHGRFSDSEIQWIESRADALLG